MPDPVVDEFVAQAKAARDPVVDDFVAQAKQAAPVSEPGGSLQPGEVRDPDTGWRYKDEASMLRARSGTYTPPSDTSFISNPVTWMKEHAATAPLVEIAQDVGKGIRAPLEKAAQTGTALGWARGVVGAGMGALGAVVQPAITGSRLLRENPDAGPVANVAGNVARWAPIPVPLGAFEKYSEGVINPLDKIAEDERKLKKYGLSTFPGAEAVGEGAALAAEVAPLVLAHKAGTEYAERRNEVRGIRPDEAALRERAQQPNVIGGEFTDAKPAPGAVPDVIPSTDSYKIPRAVRFTPPEPSRPVTQGPSIREAFPDYPLTAEERALQSPQMAEFRRQVGLPEPSSASDPVVTKFVEEAKAAKAEEPSLSAAQVDARAAEGGKSPYEPAAPTAPPEKPAPTPPSRAGEAIPAEELAALGDKAWEGVETPRPAEAPPSPFERRMQRGPQPRSSLDEANPTGDLAADIPAMRASKLWDDPNYAPYGRDPKTGKRLTSDPHALDEAAWRAANEPDFAEPRFGEADPYPEATKKLVIREAEEAAASPSPPPASNKPVVDRLNPILDRLESSRLKKEMIEQGHDVTAAEGGGLQYRRPPPASGQAPAARVPEIVNPEVATKRAVVEGVPKWQGGGEVTTQAIDARSQAIREAIKNVRAVDRYGNPERPSGLLNAALAGDDLSGAMWIENLDRATPREITKQYVDAVRAAVPDATFADMKFALTGKAPKVQAAAPHAELPAPAAPSAPDVPAAPASPDPSPAGGAAVPPTMGNRQMGKGGGESGAVRIPTGKEVVKAYDTAEATGQKAYQAVTHPVADAVSKIADAIPGVKRLRQWGIHESLAIDPTERLYQGHERRIGRIEEGRRQAEIGARGLDKATANLGSRDATEVGKYMDGERPDLPAAAKPQQAAIDRAVADMHQTRTEMLNRKLISQAVYDEYPRFLSRIYRVMAREGRTGFGAAKVAKLSEELYRQDAHGVVVSLPEAEAAMVAQPHSPKVVTGTNAQTLLKFDTPQAREAFVNDVQAWDAARKGRGPGAKEGLVIERFEPLPPDVREALGEITSPGDRFAMTLAKARAKIATHDLLASMETMGKGQKGGDWIMPNGAGPALKGYTQVVGRGWGPLEGKWLRNDIHEYATSIVDGKSADAVSSALRGAYGQWKFDRTVGSLPTVMRNLLSSHWMSVEAGVNYLNPRNWPAWKEAIETLAGRNEARRKWATENGIITNDFYAREFKARVDRALAGSDNPAAAVWEALKASKDETLSSEAQQRIINRGAAAAGEAAVNPLTAVPGAQYVKRAMGTIYSWENNSRRLAAAIKLEKQGLPMPELLKRLDRVTENYGRQGGAQQLAQNVPLIGPFARFTWERYRIFKNNLVDHPVVVGETLLYAYLLKKALEAHFGKNVTDEEKKAVGQEFGSQTVAMDPDETGKVRTYDPRWTFPYGQVMAGPETDKAVGEEGRAWMNYAARILGGGLAPGIEPIMALTTGKDSRNRPVADSFSRHRFGPLATAGETWRQYVGPPIFGRHFDQFDAAMHGRPFSSRQPVQSPEDVVLGYLTGVSLGKLDIDVARKNLETLFDTREREVIGDAGKRIRGGEDAEAIKAEARDIVLPVKESLQARKGVLDAAALSRSRADEIEKKFGRKP